MKPCICCGETKQLDQFYKHPKMKDGHLNKCISCCIFHSREHRLSKLTTIQAYDRARAKRKRESGDWLPIYAKWQARNPEKQHARITVNNAVRDGRLQKLPCEVCGEVSSHGHHDDYSKPLSVIWLCAFHHGERHRELNALKRAAE